MREGSTIGQYRVLRKIGEGGMGVVFVGEHMLIGRRPAIKVLEPEFSEHKETIDRFFNEARATSAIRDPVVGAHELGSVIVGSNPVQTFDAFSDDNGTFFGQEMTLGVPRQQFIHSHADGYVDTFAYPALPVSTDSVVTIEEISTDQVGMLATQLSIDVTKAFMMVGVVDCNDAPVAGASVTVTTNEPANQVVVSYFANGSPDPTAHVTDPVTGGAFVSGLTEGPATIHVELGDTPYIDNMVTTIMGTLTLAEISP